MDATFIGLLQSQINSLKESEVNSDNNTIILETIKLLFRNVDLSTNTLSLYDKFEMRRLFATFNEIGKQVCSFYNGSKLYLDPAAINGSIGKTIFETEEKIESTTAAFDKMSTKEAYLLEKEDELRAVDVKYKILKDKSTELRTIYENVSENVISSIEKENKQLEANIKEHKKYKENIDNENKKLRKLLSEVEEANTEINNEQHKIKSNIIAIIEKQYDEIRSIYMNSCKSLDKIKADIEKYISDFENLDMAILEHTKLKAFYETWLGENSAIIEIMRKDGLENINQITDAINNVKANIEHELKAYDMIIKKIVITEEAAREAIERKQNKVV